MFDAHYDLLTWLYCDYLKNKPLNNKLNNIKSGIFNLYFMPIKDMKKELDSKYWSDKTVSEMFEISTNLFNHYIKGVNSIFSIEGCTFLEISELETLYNLGLRALLPVWNNSNKYGGGCNDDVTGLTDSGKQLIIKAISLGIAIDLSHTNLPTFNDIINLVKLHKNLNPIIIASHSNARKLCDRKRNLTDEQLKKIREVNGYVGVLSNINFLTKNGLALRLNPKNDKKQVQAFLEQKYIEQINHIMNIVGSDKIMLASDDMSYLKDIDTDYGKLALFPYEDLKSETNNLLENYFAKETVDKILYKNGLNLLNKLK